MAINEYSDTVIEKMNKTHNEIMFLYSMLNDKHTELTDFTSELSQHLQDFKSQEEEMTNYYISQLKNQKPPEPKQPEKVPVPTVLAEKQLPVAAPVSEAATEKTAEPEAEAGAVQETEEEVNVREEILRLYEEGRDSVAIAKKLGLGVGEVRLILGLYKGD